MKNLFNALADFRTEVPVIHKATQGYGYTYADLPAIFEIINPLLEKHGLGFSQPINESGVETILYHIESGETLRSVTPIPQGVQLKGMNEFQVLGSAITYIRRYAMSSMLGLITDKDTDASSPQTPAKPAKEKPKLIIGTDQHRKAMEYVKDKGPSGLTEVAKKYDMKREVYNTLRLIVEL